VELSRERVPRRLKNFSHPAGLGSLALDVQALRAGPMFQSETPATATRAALPAPRAVALLRPAARGKFLYLGSEKLWVRGVTYGTFRGPDGAPGYPAPEQVAEDFAAIAAHGFNAVRCYTVPPRWVLDLAYEHGLRLLVGLPWEEHVAFLAERGRAASIEARVRAGVRACAGHPAVLAYAVGNEIPASIVRWHGRRRVERFLERLVAAAREEDPGGLVTYVNFPTTEYLELPSLDLVCFNVYLETRDRFEAYLARLQNLAGDRPLLLTELGLDSRRHGELAQARGLEWQVRATFAGGAAGCFVFAWTDEWHRGGHDVEDWAFGLTDRQRRPKPALARVRAALAEVPFPRATAWPRVSVVVCTHNGARTIRECLEGLLRLDYPDVEVVVVDDGSTDATAAIVRQYPVRLIRTPNRGLSSARNTGLAAATGDIVAYIDDDAAPDPHWLQYLVATLAATDHAAVGGPNIPPPDEGLVAACVARSPGGPAHVLLTDREAEHIPGCNMAFRRRALEAIGGFDPRFRTAGDDVDVCWRLREAGFTIGFSPGAVVFHRRRGSVRAFWRQQVGYGRAEALLERKWPERYNGLGHVRWGGRVYGADGGPRGRVRVYHGLWGTAPFQGLYAAPPGPLAAMTATPEWWLLIAALAAAALLGRGWAPLAWATPLLVLALLPPLGRAVLAGLRSPLPRGLDPRARVAARALIAWLHVVQPLARLWGRLTGGLAPWRLRARHPAAPPLPREVTRWREAWRAPTAVLAALERRLRAAGLGVRRGGPCDRWDLEARVGGLGAARLLLAVEEHGHGRQLFRWRVTPRPAPAALGAAALLVALAALAATDGARLVAGCLGAGGALLGARAVLDAGRALAALLAGVTADEDG